MLRQAQLTDINWLGNSRVSVASQYINFCLKLDVFLPRFLKSDRKSTDRGAKFDSTPVHGENSEMIPLTRRGASPVEGRQLAEGSGARLRAPPSP